MFPRVQQSGVILWVSAFENCGESFSVAAQLRIFPGTEWRQDKIAARGSRQVSRAVECYKPLGADDYASSWNRLKFCNHRYNGPVAAMQRTHYTMENTAGNSSMR
jgi:hypothetical protein